MVLRERKSGSSAIAGPRVRLITPNALARNVLQEIPQKSSMSRDFFVGHDIAEDSIAMIC